MDEETGKNQQFCAAPQAETEKTPPPPEFGGPAGQEPTRYGDWERGGKCVDF
jgi:hypothetical protein